LTKREGKIAARPGQPKGGWSREANRTNPARRPGTAPSRTGRGKHLSTSIGRYVSSPKNSEESNYTLAEEEAKEAVHTISAIPEVPEMSLSGVVDAIQEVGRQRKSLMDQLRSALLSGHDPAALGLARQLCGLPA